MKVIQTIMPCGHLAKDDDEIVSECSCDAPNAVEQILQLHT